DNANAAFETSIKAREYRANPRDPKGLTLDNGADKAMGISAYDLAEELCSAFGVRDMEKFGRGSQVRACVDAMREAMTADKIAGHHPKQSGREQARRSS